MTASLRLSIAGGRTRYSGLSYIYGAAAVESITMDGQSARWRRHGLTTKVIKNALCPRALTIPYMVLNFAENDGSAMELSNGTGCEDLSSWWRLVTTIVERSFVRFSESGCSNREVLP